MSYAVNLLLIVVLAYVLLLGYTLTRPKTRTVLLFAGVLACSIVWALSYYLELTVHSFEAKVLAHDLRFLVIPWIGLNWLALLNPLLGIGRNLPRWFWILSCAIAGVTVAAVLTSPWHQQFHYDFRMHPVDVNYAILVFKQGALFSIYEGYNAFVITTITIILMVQALPGASPIMRRQIILLLACYVIPVAFTVLYVLKKSPLPHVNLAPFSMALSIASLSWMVLRFKALDILPIARSVLLDHIKDLVIVTDAKGRIVDMNSAAFTAVGQPLMQCVGRTLADLPEPWNRLLTDGTGIREVASDDDRKWYDHDRIALSNDDGHPMGTLSTLRDITQERTARLLLQESKNELELLLNSMQEAIFVHDAEGRILEVNKTVLAMYGLQSRDQALGFDVLKDYSAATNDLFDGRAEWEKVRMGEPRIIPRWTVRKPLTGETFEVRIVLQPIMRKSKPLVLATIFNLTDELERQRHELEYQKLLEERKFVRQVELLIRDLHDGVGGILAAIGLVSARGLRETDPAVQRELLRKISDMAGEGNVEVRSLMSTLDSRELFWPDLITEFRRHGNMVHENHGIDFALRVEGEGDKDGPGLFAGMSLFRIFKEAVGNAVKHSGATQVDVHLGFGENRMLLSISDNGRGLDDEARSGRGLRNMRQRIGELGGDLYIANGKGLRLEFSAPIPLKSPEKNVTGTQAPAGGISPLTT